MHFIVSDFKSILLEKDDKFDLYDNQNELGILFPFISYSNKIEYGHIQYIVRLYLNS